MLIWAKDDDSRSLDFSSYNLTFSLKFRHAISKPRLKFCVLNTIRFRRKVNLCIVFYLLGHIARKLIFRGMARFSSKQSAQLQKLARMLKACLQPV